MDTGVQTFWYAQALLQRARKAGVRVRTGQRLLDDWVWASTLQQVLGFPCLVMLRRPSGPVLGLAALGGDHVECCAMHRHTPWCSANLWRAGTALSLNESVDGLALKVLASPQEAARTLEINVAQQWFARWQANKLRAQLQLIQEAVDLDLRLCAYGA